MATRSLVLLCITAVISAQPSKIHEVMTDGERTLVFGDDFGEDTNYEVTPIAHGANSEKPNHRILQLTSFSREMKFYLEPTDGSLAGVNTPVFKARSKPGMINNVEFERLPNAIQGKYKLYHDPANNGAFVVHHDESGFPLVRGVIDLLHSGEKLIIQPLLERFRKLFKRAKRHADGGLEYTHHHVVYKVPASKQQRDDHEDADDDYDLASDEQLVGDEAHGHVDLIAFARSKERRYRANNQVPDVVYPQALLVLEASYFKLFNRDVERAIEYQLAFWNGVDLRYRAYRQPDVRLNIAGIILAEDAGVTPYIERNEVRVPGLPDGKISVVDALRSYAGFMYPETRRNASDETLTMSRLDVKFDFAITMTKLDMCQLPEKCVDEETREYTCAKGRRLNAYCSTLGFAYYTGACAYDDEYREMEGVGIIEDTGSFFGVIPAAHEVGHLLGASHDQYNEHGCDWDDGYLMSYSMVVSDKSFVWSNCSAESVKKFLKKESRARCMFDRPNTGDAIPRELPGRLYSRDEVCRRAMGTRDCPEPWYNQRCDVLYCEVKNPRPKDRCTWVRNHAVPEGSFCGNGFHCLNAECVKKTNAYVHLQLATTTTTEAPPPQSAEDWDMDNLVDLEYYEN